MLPFSLIYREGFYLPLGAAHVFPGVKYKLIRERLLETRVAHAGDFVEAEPIALTDVLRVHEAGFVDRLVNGTLAEEEIRRMELPYSKELVQATLLGCGGTLQAARLALKNGIAMSIGGGFHHAHPDHGEGFCILHDVAIALRRLLTEGTVRREYRASARGQFRFTVRRKAPFSTTRCTSPPTRNCGRKPAGRR